MSIKKQNKLNTKQRGLYCISLQYIQIQPLSHSFILSFCAVVTGMANTDNISDVAAPLTGCISNVRVNKKKIKLQAEAIEKVDVFTCESSP